MNDSLIQYEFKGPQQHGKQLIATCLHFLDNGIRYTDVATNVHESLESESIIIINMIDDQNLTIYFNNIKHNHKKS